MSSIGFVISEDWVVVSHFLPLIREAIACGLEPVVVTRVSSGAAQIEREGARVIVLGRSPRESAIRRKLLFSKELVSILRRERFDIVYCVSIRMCFLAGLAARLAGISKLILAPTGLGHLWIVDATRHRIYRALVRLVVGRILNSPNTRYIFENRDDPGELCLSPNDPNVVIVNGAGVDGQHFTALEDPGGSVIKVAVVSRMTRQKGVEESIRAVRLARSRGANLELNLYGLPDRGNPSYLSEGDIRNLIGNDPAIRWHGSIRDVREVWKSHHVALLLSHREGLPRSLVEASACGRPIVTTDVVGCKEVVRHGVDGFLVPLGDIPATAEALVRLAND